MTFPSLHASVQADFNPAPSMAKPAITKVGVAPSIPKGAGGVGFPVGVDGDVPRELGIDRAALSAAGFEGKIGQTLIIPRSGGPILVAVGIGKRAELDAAKLRDAAAAFGRSMRKQPHIAAMMVEAGGLAPDVAAQAIVEGALLARYRYLPLKQPPEHELPLGEVTLVAASTDPIKAGIERGAIAARAAHLARDLANAPATLLTARKMAEIAQTLATASGLEIEIFDGEALAKLGCGGLLGVNAGSAEPPRMIKLSYRPKGEPVGNLALVGKGIMYDSGGISLKPNDRCTRR